MTHTDWVPADVDTETPSAARMYDYLLGGGYNFKVDRELADRVRAAFPDITHTALVNRAFLVRTVRWAAEQGIRQFLDIGCGLPTAGAVHQVAQSVNLDARVMYVDNEPVAVAHSELLVAGVPGVEVIQADLRYPETFLEHEKTQRLLDFREPVAVLLAAVLHFVLPGDNPTRLMAKLREALPAGSVVVMSHVTADGGGEDLESVRRLYEQSQNPGVVRDRQQVLALMAGLELVPPGMVWVSDWHPDAPDPTYQSERSHLYGAVGRVR